MKRAKNAEVKVMVKLPGDIHAAVQEMAKMAGRSVKFLVRELALKGFLVTLEEVQHRHAKNAKAAKEKDIKEDNAK